MSEIGRIVGTAMWRFMVLALLLMFGNQMAKTGVIPPDAVGGLQFVFYLMTVFVVVLAWVDVMPLKTDRRQAAASIACGGIVAAIGLTTTVPEPYMAELQAASIRLGFIIAVAGSLVKPAARLLERELERRGVEVS